MDQIEQPHSDPLTNQYDEHLHFDKIKPNLLSLVDYPLENDSKLDQPIREDIYERSTDAFTMINEQITDTIPKSINNYVEPQELPT